MYVAMPVLAVNLIIVSAAFSFTGSSILGGQTHACVIRATSLQDYKAALVWLQRVGARRRSSEIVESRVGSLREVGVLIRNLVWRLTSVTVDLVMSTSVSPTDT